MNNTHEDQGQIPESSSFIPESTLIPHSEQMIHVPETGERKYSSDDGGLPGGSSKGLKTANANRPNFIKRNLPLIFIVVVAGGIGGSILYKKSHVPVVAQTEAQTQMATVEQAVIPAPVPQSELAPAPMPAPVIPIVEISQLAPEPVAKLVEKDVVAPMPSPIMKPVTNETSVPVAAKLQLPLLKPETKSQTATAITIDPVKGAGAATPVKIAKTSIDAASEVVHSGVSVTPTPIDDLNIKTARTNEDNPAAKKRIAQLKSELGQAQNRIAELESALKVEKAHPRVTTEATPALLKTARKTHRAMRYASKKIPDSQRHVEQERAGGFSISAVRNGLAWIDTPDGLITVREGDFIPGFGRVAHIDEDKVRVSSGNRFIE